jgi:hypothetical protein
MRPGAIVLTVIPYAPSSNASVLDQLVSAAGGRGIEIRRNKRPGNANDPPPALSLRRGNDEIRQPPRRHEVERERLFPIVIIDLVGDWSGRTSVVDEDVDATAECRRSLAETRRGPLLVSMSDDATAEPFASRHDGAWLLAYQRFISHDRLAVYVHERYEHSGAAVAHLVKFAATFGERYGRLIERKRFLVFGNSSDDLRAILDKYGATYHRPFGPFPYWG